MQIRRFLELLGEFVNTHIDTENDNGENFQDDEELEKEKDGAEKLKGTLGGKDIIQLKNNFIPGDLIPLEFFFYQNDVAKNPKVKPDENVVEDRNIGTEENAKIIKLSKNFPVKEKEECVNLMKKYTDVFSWSYEDLKEYDTSIIQHTIPIKTREKPFKQKLRRINPKLLPIIEKEIKNLFDTKIIMTLRFSKWVANLVPVRKKNGEIRIFIDFINLNKVSLKDNYPFPKTEHILHKVVGSERI